MLLTNAILLHILTQVNCMYQMHDFIFISLCNQKESQNLAKN